MKKTVAEQAQAFRESKGWNPTDMAKHVGVNRQDICNLEAHPNRKPRYIDKLAIAMGCTVDDLLSGKAMESVKVEPLFRPMSLEETLKSLSVYLAELDPSDRVDAMRLIERLAESPERYAKTAAAIEAMRSAPFTALKQA